VSGRVKGSWGWRLPVAAAVPAAVSVGVVVFQAAEVAVPARCAVSQCAKVLKGIASDRSTALGYGWAGAGVLLLVGAAFALLLVRSRASTRSHPLERERLALIRACIEVSDVVPSDALREQLVDALANAGVTAVQVAAGERFDSSRHHAVGRVESHDRAAHNRVAKMERPGYVDHGRRLRYPDVLVFNADGGVKS
jgi:hypothetical protein